MKINQEKFEELSQLDRIELIQRIERLEGKFPFFLGDLNLFFVLMILTLFVLDIWCIVRIGESIINLGVLLVYVFVCFLVGVFLQFFLFFIKAKKLNELEGKFFEIKVKGKSK